MVVMNEPQSQAVGGFNQCQGLVVQLLGPDDVAKVNLFNQINQLLLLASRRPKLLYLPNYQDFEVDSPQADLLAANLASWYLAQGYDVITNIGSLTTINPRQVLSFKAGGFRPKLLLAKLSQAPANLVNLAAATRAGQLQPLAKATSPTNYLPLAGLEPADQTAYQQFVSRQLELYQQLVEVGFKTSAARAVLPVAISQSISQASSSTSWQLATKDWQQLPLPQATNRGSQQLVETSPVNELQLVEQILHEAADLSYQAIRDETKLMSYRRKRQLLVDYIKQTKGRGNSLKLVNYQFEICASLASCLRLLSGPLTNLNLQLITPNLGYPDMAQPTNLTGDDWQAATRASFERSQQIWQAWQAKYGSQVAENVCLLGHRVRLRLNLNPYQLHLAKGRLAQRLQNLAEVCHPLINQSLASSKD